MTHGILADRDADRPASNARRPPVDAAPHAGVHDRISHVLEVREGLDDTRCRRAGEADDESRIASEHVLEHLLRRPRVRGVTGDVIGKRRCDEQRGPLGIGVRGWIAIGPGRANSGDWTPLAVRELRVPGGNERVGTREVEEREGPGILRKRQAMSDGRLTSRRIPVLGGRGDPEPRDIGFVLAARAARARPDGENLGEITCVSIAAQRRRRPRPELRPVAQEEWLHTSPTRIESGQKCRRRGNPVARPVARNVGGTNGLGRTI